MNRVKNIDKTHLLEYARARVKILSEEKRDLMKDRVKQTVLGNPVKSASLVIHDVIRDVTYINGRIEELNTLIHWIEYLYEGE